MHHGIVTGTEADMLSQCDEKYSEMMWRECSYCPKRDGRLTVVFVQSFVRSVRVCGCILGYSLVALCVVHFILFGPAFVLFQQCCKHFI